MALLETYEIILHPNLFNALKKQVVETCNENREEAFREAKISDDARWIEKELTEMKKSIESDKERGHNLGSFRVKCLYREFLKRYLNP